MNFKRLTCVIMCAIIQLSVSVYAETNFTHYYNYNSEINQYNNIIAIYDKINKNKDNKTLYYEYIETVENYLNNYGKISLNMHSLENYALIMQRLGVAYYETANVNKAITIYETLSEEYPSNINLTKALLYLYDKANSCSKAYYTYNKIRLIESNFKYIFINCYFKTEETQNNLSFDNVNTQNLSFNNVNNKSTKVNVKKNNNYDWKSVYEFFFILWGLIFVIAFSNNKKDVEDHNLPENYVVKYKNKRPIKPEFREFGLDNTSYEKIDKIINDKKDSADIFTYAAPIISMWATSVLFNAPSLFFPIFYKEPYGVIFGFIFYFVSLIAIIFIKDKYEKFINRDAIQSYYRYNNAIFIYKEAKDREYWQQKSYWENLSPFEFETAIGKLFKYLGYNVKITQKSRDGGIDILIRKENIIKGVQCKHYKGKVGAKEVRELWGVKDYFKFNNKVLKLDGVIMVALSGVSKEGNDFISGFQNYELWTIDTIITEANNTNYLY